MKIAQIAPLAESVPPRGYGGTERIVSYLTEELVQQGHDVTLFASGDSITRGKLVKCCDRALRTNPAVRDHLPYYMMMMDRVASMASQFDVLHFHVDQFHFPMFRSVSERTLTTLHGRQDLFDLQTLYRAFPEMPLVSISNAQRAPIPFGNFVATVHHGLPADVHPPTLKNDGKYLAFIGRISSEKRVDRAIRIAQAVGMPLKIAAKIDRADQEYYDAEIAPIITGPGIEFIGEIDERGKTRFFGDAAALLFPIDWPEPFGLVMIEAMQCGTPVLAFRAGSVPEVITEGVTGHIVSSEEEAIATLPKTLALDRRRVRQEFETRFAASRMAADYCDLYEAILERPPIAAPHRRVSATGLANGFEYPAPT